MDKQQKVKVMLFGTFDILHPGHLNLFEQARGLATDLEIIVSIARDVNVEKIKGRLPRNNEQQRLNRMQSVELIDRAILGSLEDYMEHIKIEQPDIIALGYDQEAYTQTLRNDLDKSGLVSTQIIRLKPFEPDKYKTSLLWPR
ncbi:MAG: adenylyltransferase/cytidyltransferase family protein [Candidatus Doudnabacteria bacterium]